MIKKNKADYEVVIPAEILALLGWQQETDGSQDQVLIHDLERVGRKIYFTVETSRPDSSLDMGWRPGYRRISTAFYCMESGGQPELIYSC